jgi:hypothetical protein
MMRAILASLSVVALATAGVFMHQKAVEVAAFMSKVEEVSTFEIKASEMANDRAHAATGQIVRATCDRGSHSVSKSKPLLG